LNPPSADLCRQILF